MSTEVKSWQEGLSLAARQRHMMETGLHSDVTFEVGHAPGVTVAAHRLILMSASPVFEAMFYGKLAAAPGDLVRVEDIELNIFRELLR